MSAMDMLRIVTSLIPMTNINYGAVVNTIHVVQIVRCVVQVLNKNDGDNPSIMSYSSVNVREMLFVFELVIVK